MPGAQRSTNEPPWRPASHHQTESSSKVTSLRGGGDASCEGAGGVNIFGAWGGSLNNPPTVAAIAAIIGEGVIPNGGSTNNPLAAKGCCTDEG
jgi:hypothetical protein